MGNLRALLLAVLLVPALLVGCGEQPSGDPGGTGGGTGGSAGGAGGGAGGGTVDAGSCSTPSDCPGVDTECRTRTCTSGVCGATNAPVTQVLGSQDAGDCQQRRCDGAGNVVSVADDADVPLDSNPCTRDVCAGGVVSHPGADAGTSCGDGGWVCDGAGSCGECNSVAQCAGADSECSARTCVNHACGTWFADAGAPTSTQVSGDCLSNQCNGAGVVVSSPDPADTAADDGNACTLEACSGGQGSVAFANTGTACNFDGGTVCDGQGGCRECNVAADCGAGSECTVYTCVNHACGVTYPTLALVMQTAGDCQVMKCDGAGNEVSVDDDNDSPASDGNQCTDEVCVNGAPASNNTVGGTACNENGGRECDGNGACVQCIAASECSGQDTQCSTRVCNSGFCGTMNTQQGTALTAQVSGDCQRAVCDGNGGTTTEPLDTDVPSSTEQCQTAGCSFGTVTMTPVNTGTQCNQDGGTKCDGYGSCVQCLDADECPGTDTECRTRSCYSNLCGFDFTAADVAVSSQTDGDCKRQVCDGDGGVRAANDDFDPPVDSSDCTDDVCNNGTPSNPPSAINTSCFQSSGYYCDGAGQCVGCNQPDQCPGSDTDCQSRTCVNHACGTSFAANGTPTPGQTDGDCETVVCDGQGGVRVDINDADVPDDGTLCTVDTCNNGVPTYTQAPTGTACRDNNGLTCDDFGVCMPPEFAVVRVGDGTTVISSKAHAVFVEYRDYTGAIVTTLPMPTAASGSNLPLALAGTILTDGVLTRSSDEQYLVLAGYGVAPGYQDPFLSNSTLAPRVVGRISGALSIDTTTRVSAFGNEYIRGAATTNGSAFWVFGTNAGLRFTPLGSTGASTAITGAATAQKAAAIYDSQLYLSSTGPGPIGILKTATPLPTNSSATSLLSGTGGGGPGSFVFFDLDSAVPGVDRLYVADVRQVASGGGLLKYTTTDGVNWTLAATINTISGGATTPILNVTGKTDDGHPVLYAVSYNGGYTGNQILKLVDDPAVPNPVFTVLSTAPANTGYRGISVPPY